MVRGTGYEGWGIRYGGWASGTIKPETSAGISSFPRFRARKDAKTQLKNRFAFFGFSDLVVGRALRRVGAGGPSAGGGR